MLTVYEVDYNDKTYKVGTADDLKEAKKLARAALKKSHGEFPTFISDGHKCIWSSNNAPKADLPAQRGERKYHD